MNKSAEVSMIAYNGNAKSAKMESFITGTVVKTTSKYIHIRNHQDGTMWKALRVSK